MAQDIGAIIDPTTLALLRKAYNNEDILALAQQSLVGRFAPAGPFIAPLVARFYATKDHMPPIERERIVIALLAAQQSHPELAVHFYWGLMEGLPPDNIAEILLLVMAYAGTNNYNAAIRLLELCLTALSQQPHDALDARSCLALMDKVARDQWSPNKEKTND